MSNIAINPEIDTEEIHPAAGNRPSVYDRIAFERELIRQFVDLYLNRTEPDDTWR